jgi:nitrogen fixation-related uncharacterized protein
VSFLIEVLWALLMVGVPIAAFTLAMFWWALERGHFKESKDTKALSLELKLMSKKGKKNKSKKADDLHPVLKKWGQFGGGFYGIVGLFTYIVIEVREVIDMIIGFGGVIDFLKQLDFGLIIDIFVAAIMNFVAAIIWPLYWLKRIDTEQTWIWFVVAYAGYYAGMKAAQILVQRRSGAKS